MWQRSLAVIFRGLDLEIKKLPKIDCTSSIIIVLAPMREESLKLRQQEEMEEDGFGGLNLPRKWRNGAMSPEIVAFMI